MNFKIRNIFVVLIAAFLLSGCIGVNRDFQKIRANILDSVDDEFQKDVEFAVGPGLIYFAGLFVRFAEEEDENIEEIFDNVSNVQVGVYNRSNYGSGEINLSYLKNVDSFLQSDGWEFLVKARDRDEISSVYVKAEGEDLNSIFVIALSDDELVLAEISGDLDKLIEVIIREEGLHLASSDN